MPTLDGELRRKTKAIICDLYQRDRRYAIATDQMVKLAGMITVNQICVAYPRDQRPRVIDTLDSFIMSNRS